MWDSITYPFPNFNGTTVEFREWISNFVAHYTGQVITYPFRAPEQQICTAENDGSEPWYELFSTWTSRYHAPNKERFSGVRTKLYEVNTHGIQRDTSQVMSCPFARDPLSVLFVFVMNSVFGHLHFASWWRHLMETFPALLALCVGIHRSPVNSPHKGQWGGALIFSLTCAWTNGSVNNRDVGDLRRHRAHYGVIVYRFIYHWITRSWHFHYTFMVQYEKKHATSIKTIEGARRCLYHLWLNSYQWLSVTPYT